jgi:hypothetical protein
VMGDARRAYSTEPGLVQLRGAWRKVRKVYYVIHNVLAPRLDTVFTPVLFLPVLIRFSITSTLIGPYRVRSQRQDMAKRAAPQEEGTLIKRARSSEPEANNQQLAISSSNDERQKALIRSVKRTSNLEAPIISLSGAHAVSFSMTVLLGYSRQRGHSGGNIEL